MATVCTAYSPARNRAGQQHRKEANMAHDQELWDKLFHELACIKSELKAFKLETRAELYQIKS